MDKNKTKDDKKDSAKQIDTQNKSEKDESELLKQKIEELGNQNKRLLADYRNLEKRVENEKREWVLKANRSLLLNLLPILDTLMFADKNAQGKDQNVNLTMRQFLDILKKEGVEKIETHDANFDPNLMECIETVEGEEGKVIEEIRAGYTLYGETLKPALVRVGGKKGN